MSCRTCSNCGFVNFPSLETQLQTLKATQSSDSLISQILRGSQPLLEADHASIREEIAKLEPFLSWYDAQLQEIQSHCPALLKALEDRKSIYAPIRRLPREILVEIFHLVCDSWWKDVDDSEGNELKRHSLDLSGPLWVLGRVCGLWRGTLHTSPVSWAWHVSVKTTFSLHAREILQTYLERTGKHPLSLMIMSDSGSVIKDGEIIPKLVECCHRWKNLRIHASIHHMRCLDSISHLPFLQTIEMDITRDYDHKYRSDICLKAPRLWQATLPSQGISQVRLPTGITHYSGSITCREDLQLLSQLPKLRTCHLESNWMSSAPTEAPVVTAELCELYVENPNVLSLLTAPILQSLTICTSESLSSITLFLRRSRCHLNSFSICMDVLESESLASISNMFSFEAFSTVSHLKLEFGSVWHNSAKALTPSSILPNLCYLVLCFENEFFYLTQTELVPLFDMIRSRCKARQLKTIEVQFNDEVGGDFDDRDIEADIRALIGDNLEMRVEKWSPLHLDHRLLFWDP